MINIGLPFGESLAGTNTKPSAPKSPAAAVFGSLLKSRVLFMYCTNSGLVGLVMSYTITPPIRSSPTKANVLLPSLPIAMPSGSGPLLSLRLSKAFSSWFELK